MRSIRIEAGMSETHNIVLEAKNLAVTFKVEGGQVEAVRNVNFALCKGETIAIVGESGSGKSVTARAIMRLLSRRASIGKGSSITLNGRDVVQLNENEMRKLRGSRVSMIFQEPMTSLNPSFTVGAQIAEVIRIHNRISAEEAMARAQTLLEEGQIPEPDARQKQDPPQLT